MAFFLDNTPHSYSPTRGLEVWNIGWLDDGQPFAVGATSKEFQNALLELCEHPIILHRGIHPCGFCRKQKGYGNGQIRVLSKKRMWYAAPTLVHHYVVKHGYLPPADFVDTVISPMAVAIDHGWFD